MASFSQTPLASAWWRSSQRSQSASVSQSRSAPRRRALAATLVRAGGMTVMFAPAIVGRRPATGSLLWLPQTPLYDLMIVLSTHRRGRPPREDPDRRRGSDHVVGRDRRAQRRLAHARPRLRDPPPARGRVPPDPVQGLAEPDRRDLAQPADRRRGAAVPDHQGPARHAAAARDGTSGRRRCAGARRVLVVPARARLQRNCDTEHPYVRAMQRFRPFSVDGSGSRLTSP